MKGLNYYNLKKAPDKKRLLIIIVDFLSANINNPELAEKIQLMAKEVVAKDPKRSVIRSYNHPEIITSKSLLYDYLFKIVGEKSTYDSVIDDLLDLLEEKNIIVKDFTHGVNLGSLKDQEYLINTQLLKYLLNNNILYNYLLGFGQVIEHYKKSVYKIEVVQDRVIGIGTGWIIDYIKEGKTIRFLVTNHHVIENASSIKVLNVDNVEIQHYETESFVNEDVAFMRIDIDAQIPDFSLSMEQELLLEIITIGYPSIPTARDAFQVVHKGEVNAYLDDYFGQELFVVSARTAPGNSGSPVLDEKGLVVGMVARELFEKSAFQEKGIVPYSACIPSKIIKSLFDSSEIANKYFTK